MQTRKTPPKRTVHLARPRMQSVALSAKLTALIAAALALVLGFLLQYRFFPNGLFPQKSGRSASVTEITATSPVRVNEIMTSNGSAWSDERGEFCDWIELYNSSSTESVDITGWLLADQVNSLNVFTFPQQVLEPGAYVLVFCDGVLRNAPGATYHAPFKLSSDGDSVILFNSSETAVQAVNVPALNRNQSYALTDTGWAVTSFYTPCMPNEESYYRLMVSALSDGQTAQVVISEVMADNATYIPDEDGEYCDWIEIHNTGSTAVSLKNWCLSDNSSNPTKWRFPDVTIGPDEYMVIYCSGKSRCVAGAPLHTGFSLSAEGEMAVLSNEQGVCQSSVSFANMKADRSLSLRDGEYTFNLAPTPGMPNNTSSAAAIEREFASANPVKVYLSECSGGTSRTVDTDGTTPEWLELHNSSTVTVDLSGWGLSDDPSHPRKWQFNEGASIRPGEYLVVYLTGEDKQDASSSKFYANFGLSLSSDALETLTLCTPEGVVVDRMPLLKQYASVSYGRIDGQDGFFYFPKSTPGAQNSSMGYAARTEPVSFSIDGGLYDEPVTISLSAQPGATLRYTTDGSVPTSESPVYEGPITVDSTTVLRARAWRDQEYPSVTTTQTYFMGVHHTMNVMSVVMDPADLWSKEKGLYVLGASPLSTSPYGSINNGANFWMTWEKSGHIEYYGTDGSTILDQGAGLKLHGQYSRSEVQKAFKVIARSEYDESNRFCAALFSERDYTEYQSFILRSSGSDGDKSRMRDSILTSLAENTSVMYQATECVIVYLNGQYWGQYNMRERINQYSIAQWEGWTDPENIDLVKANTNVLKGSNESYAQMLAWVKKNGVKNDAALQRVAEVVDLDNYIDYICLELYTGNTDTLNVKRYRNAVSGDGKWRWIFFDLDWAMYTNTNSIARWLDPDGMGNGKRTDNSLFVNLMGNSTFRDRFCTRLGYLMAHDFSAQAVVSKINDRVQLLMPEMEQHTTEWLNLIETWYNNGASILPSNKLADLLEPSSAFTVSKWKTEVNSFKNYAETRPVKLLGYIKDCSRLALTDEEFNHYFGEAVEVAKAYGK